MKSIKYINNLFFLIISISTVISQPLTGIKTIGGNTPDFATFNLAVYALSTQGVGYGGVVFKIRAGAYYENQVTINSIFGSYESNPVIFESESGDASDVIIRNINSTNSNNYTIYLKNTKYIIFRNLTLEGNNTTPYSRILYSTGSTSIIVENCIFNGKVVTTTTSGNALLYISSSTNYQVSNNVFNDGSIGIYFYSNSSTDTTTIINNNVFNDQYSYPIECFSSNAKIVANNINKSSSGDGILVWSCENYLHVDGNLINAADGSGIRIWSCQFNSNRRGKFTNNIITAKNGIYLWGNTYYIDIFNNTVSASFNSLKIDINSSDIDVKNNIFEAGVNAALVENPSSSNIIFDYNDYFSTTPEYVYLGTSYYSLPAWKSVSMQDSNSIDANPLFISANDLHVQSNSPVIDKGKTITDILNDFDGDIREVGYYDIGADEISQIDMITEIFNEITVFPNPVKDKLNIKAYFKIENLKIFNSNGQVVFADSYSEKDILIDISNFEYGVYFLEIVNGERKYIRKYIKN